MVVPEPAMILRLTVGGCMCAVHWGLVELRTWPKRSKSVTSKPGGE